MKRFFLLVALALFLWPAAPQAHPTASTFVVVRVPGDGTVVVDVTANEKTLSLALAALSDGAARLDGSAGIAGDLERLADLSADGARLKLKCVEIANTPDREGLVTARLTGSLPAGAATLHWRAPFLLSAYPLSVVGGSMTAAPDRHDWIAGDERSREYRLDAIGSGSGAWASAIRMIPTGFAHILPLGLDHMLFMIGLFLMSTSWRSLLLQVSAFTVAHSLTLALGVFGAVSIPSRIVEPLIAASIAFIAIENIFSTGVSKWRLFVVFIFGLLHGLGFAGAMADLGLSGTHLVGSLVGFNVGVEIGQLTVIAMAALVVKALRLPVNAERQFILRPASAAIALVGLFWAIKRTF